MFRDSARPLIGLVEDDAAVRDSVRTLLECDDLDVCEFGSGEEFLSGDQASSDCLILDVNLPGISGLELLERLRSGGDHRAAVVISAKQDLQMRDRITAAHACFLEKPFDPEKLLDVVHDALRHVPDCGKRTA